MKPTDPARCRYPGQPEEEVTKQVFYKSFVMVLPVVVAGLILGALAFLGMSYGAAHPEIRLDQYLPVINGSAFAMFCLLAFVLTGLLMFGAIWIWRNNRILVTNEHIVDIDQVTLFRRSVATLTLSRIQDVSAEIAGPVQTVFQYGTVVIQTAGQQEKFKFDYLPHPYDVEQYVLEVHKEYLAEHGETDGLVERQGLRSNTGDTPGATINQNPLEQ